MIHLMSSPAISSKLSIMGIVNTTPDSFSDGGEFIHPQSVWHHIAPWINHNIPWIDLGAESTRPRATPLTPQQEWQRLEPILDFLSSKDLRTSLLSVDSRHPATQLRALEYPAVHMINCVDGQQCIHNRTQVAQLRTSRRKLHYVAMHMHGWPDTMQDNPLDAPATITKVDQFFKLAYQSLQELGYHEDTIWLDPGIGFGKTREACWQLIKSATDFRVNYQLCYGMSRKSFLVNRHHTFRRTELDLLSHELTRQLITSSPPAAKPLMIRTHDPMGLVQRLA